MAFEPGAGVGQQSETGRVAFRKTVFAETLDLAVDGFGEIFFITFVDHAIDQFAFEFVEAAFALPCRHRTSQAIGFTFGKARRDHGDLHYLFLKNWHTSGSAQCFL